MGIAGYDNEESQECRDTEHIYFLRMNSSFGEFLFQILPVHPLF
jgi:hypothetical protein